MRAYDIEDLTKIYPRQTLPANNQISLAIEEGEFFGLLGDNGAGKTTLVKQMANLLAPNSGTIRLFGKPLDYTALYTPGLIGYMPQSGLALNNLTVGESLYFTAHLRGLSRRDARTEGQRVIEQLGLGMLRDHPITRLSGGQRRLVLLGTTMTASPAVMILDEPTIDLDPQNRVLVWDMLRRINTDVGTTIILVTHNVLEAEKVIQRVGIMKEGQLVALGRPGALKAELNRQLRLEVVFTPENPPLLPTGAVPHPIAPGRWLLLIDRGEASAYLEVLSQAEAVEDFRLSTATLEDLYLSLVDKQG
jgi:ABC-type multidrug transport system ATPase subunit